MWVRAGGGAVVVVWLVDEPRLDWCVLEAVRSLTLFGHFFLL